MFWWLYYADRPSAEYKELPLVMWLQVKRERSTSVGIRVLSFLFVSDIYLLTVRFYISLFTQFYLPVVITTKTKIQTNNKV